jgi:GNAT superfamily N-acetyltransferase
MSATFPIDRIRPAKISDLALLAEIERAAAGLFADTPYSAVVDDEPLSLDFVTEQFRGGRVWVAVDERDLPIGYAIAQVIDGCAYLRQIDVRPTYQRRGIGSKLVDRVCIWAQSHNYRQILLSTFLDIEWNAPFYAKLGFKVLPATSLSSGFQQLRSREAAAGLPIDRRCIMYRHLAPAID